MASASLIQQPVHLMDHHKPGDRSTVYILEGQSSNNFVSLEKGNFAYLLECDVGIESDAATMR